MTELMTSRRMLIAAGGAALAASAHAQPGETTEATVRRWYKLWEQRDWAPFDAILSERFTFSSAAGDDHISKSVFKTRCWESQKDFTDHFEILRLFPKGDEAFVQYVGHTTNGKTFRNVELIQVKDGQLLSIDCYFGGHATFPSAVSAAKS
jgi:ketosteroid isomerase-like protein